MAVIGRCRTAIGKRQLDALVAAAEGDAGWTAVIITAIDGTAGVGKTALAVHWASVTGSSMGSCTSTWHVGLARLTDGPSPDLGC